MFSIGLLCKDNPAKISDILLQSCTTQRRDGMVEKFNINESELSLHHTTIAHARCEVLLCWDYDVTDNLDPVSTERVHFNGGCDGA